MNLRSIAAVLVISLLAGGAAAARPDAQPDAITETPKWPQEPKWAGPGPMPRHHVVRLWGVPMPYAGMTNPLPPRKATYWAGAAIYERHCVSCHGQDGAGDGPAGRGLSPPPGNLVWLSDVPQRQWDQFMVWTITEGGTALGSSMPSFKEVLSRDEIWAVSAYIKQRMPFDIRMQ